MKWFWRNDWILVIGWLLAIMPQAFTQQTQNEARLEFRVRYVTPEAVYFNGGAKLGVRAGDKVWVMRDQQKIVQLEVKYVSEHNASCLLEKENAARETAPLVRVDDLILWTAPMQEYLKRTRPPEAPVQPAQPRNKTSIQSPQPKRYANKSAARNNDLNGQISWQTFGQKDKGPQQFDFLEASAYWRMNFERPAGLPLRLMARVRSSQNYRQINSSNLQQQPALHRIYEIALEYASPMAPVELAAGRTLRYELRGAGYLDGLVLGYRFNEKWKAGVFAGSQPDLYRYNFRTDEKKLGGFLQMKTAVGKNSEIALAATGIGQYMRQQVSREYLATQADFTANRNLYLTHYFEIDLNRAWRRRLSGGAINLSNTYFNATYYPSAKISLNVSYDARRLIRTWETKTIADSLFDQSLRQGWRASVSLQPTALTRFSFDGGWQGSKDSPDVFSAGISASTANLLRSGASLSGRISYFGNALSSGYYPALDLSRSFFGVIYVTAGGGAYIYRMGNGGKSRSNPWERLRLDINLTRRFFLSSTWENFHGDTMQFVRGFVDLGWRF